MDTLPGIGVRGAVFYTTHIGHLVTNALLRPAQYVAHTDSCRGKEGEREGGREGGREGRKEGRKEGGREGGKEGGGREGRRERGREGRKEGEVSGAIQMSKIIQ